MSWLSWSNPVAIWWCFLLGVSAVNIALLAGIRARFRNNARGWRDGLLATEPLLFLSAAYVFGCAFRSVLPRADVQRICLFDTPLSSILVGRSVATLAELCFIVQWAIVLRELGRLVGSETAKNIAKLIVPLIALAECCSWYAVITTDYLGNVLENSLWTASFLLIAVALVRLLPAFRGAVQWTVAATAAGIGLYLAFMVTVDVPMYFVRWQAELARGHQFFGLTAGLHDLATRWIVTYDFGRWRHEMPWMSLYFSLAVWTSLALATFGLIKPLLPRYRARPAVALARNSSAVAATGTAAPNWHRGPRRQAAETKAAHKAR